MEKETVRFVSARPYVQKNLPVDFFCLHGRKEVVVLCSPELTKTLKELPSDYVQPRLVDIKKYLDDNGYPYTENFKNTTVV